MESTTNYVSAIVAWLVGLYGQTVKTAGAEATPVTVKRVTDKGIAQLIGISTANASGVVFTPGSSFKGSLEAVTGTLLIGAIDANHIAAAGGSKQLTVPGRIVGPGGVNVVGNLTFMYGGCKMAILGKTGRKGASRIILPQSEAMDKRAAELLALYVEKAAAEAAAAEAAAAEAAAVTK